ncbi:hypothetical protein BRYFOR_09801 [Marvinbryantia formatexigens DSM 14469]|uniref:Uncharacterized protein n=1 Tax=Marvinbryantia formatexigens DSM 14469 TaxID=478749 RepID=C6LMA2_9FIRM|nr:hypothetical protein BRYFOR_09801 [Marvinbryantia formatexigens DSM 14469]
MPRFAAFCLFCDKFNSLGAKFIISKSRQNGAEYSILEGFLFMIKVLFVCHGKNERYVWDYRRKKEFPRSSACCRFRSQVSQTAPRRKALFECGPHLHL